MSSEPLSSDARAYLALLAERAALPTAPSLEARRVAYDAFAADDALPPPDIRSAVDEHVAADGHAVAVRRYLPLQTPRATIVYAHGGGFVFGSLASFDAFCRELCARAQAEVLAVDYRLAPERRFPAAHDDVRTALVATTRIATLPVFCAGDSAGGCLALSASLAAQRSGLVVAGQILAYPCLDPRVSTPSFARLGTGLNLTATGMRWFWESYLGAPAPPLSDVSALFDGDLRGAPPTQLIVATEDPLVDEIDALGAKLHTAAVRTERHDFTGELHGFLRLTRRFRSARTAIDAMAGFVRARSP